MQKYSSIVEKKNSENVKMSDKFMNENNIEFVETCKWIFAVIGIVALALTILYLLRKFFLGPKYKNKNRIDGKVVIVTGCNTGIGKQIALELARRGGKIYMACRNYEKCEEARQEIIKETGNKNIFNMTLDLASLESIREFVKKFLKEESRLDILVNNAGVAVPKRMCTSDGFELHFGVNHLGHFLLTNLLLDTLKASAPSRIVVVTSGLYWYGRINKNDLMYEKNYIGLLAYSNSKLANILFTTTLARKLNGTGVTINCGHPGVVKTEIGRHYMNPCFGTFIEGLLYLFLKTSEAGAQTPIRLALDPDLENVSGNYYVDCYWRLPLFPKARNREMGEWLWNKSAELTGLIPSIPQTVLQIEDCKNTS